MSSESMMASEISQVGGIIIDYLPIVMGRLTEMAQRGASPEILNEQLRAMSRGASAALRMESRTYTKYNNLPYKVEQMGLSLNVDWIISPKLIAKLNANLQNTVIDSYYRYSKSEQVAKQMALAQQTAQQTLYSENNIMYSIAGNIIQNGAENPEALIGRIIQPAPYITYKEKIGWDNMSEVERNTLLQNLFNAGMQSQKYEDIENPLAMYYAIIYDVQMLGSELYFGSSYAQPYTTRDDHRHKATPTVYGMAGLIYKPINQVNISAFCNYVGHHTFDTEYASTKINDRFTLNLKAGYSPTDRVEFFVNAHNLFDNQKREFPYGDKIGGQYSVGVNFAF